MKEDSLKKRYLYKLLTNAVSLPIALIVQAITPRILGPVFYGNFSFITGFFNSIISFLDSGTSIGFYTKLSQRQGEKALIRFYWQFVLLILVLFILVVSVILLLGFREVLWPDQVIMVIYLGLFWAWLTWVYQITQKVLDALGYTKASELIRTLQKSFACLLLIGIYLIRKLTLEQFFYYHFIVISLYVICSFIYLKRKRISLFPSVKIDYKKYSKEFYTYSAPLVSFAFLILLVGVFDRWIIQKFYGSIEQGFYGLAYQIGAVCFLFSSAMTPLFTRELSIAQSYNDIKRMKYLFLKFVPLLYFVAAYFSIFISVNGETVMMIMGGEDYSGAVVVIAIMAFYPIHQTYGQLTGAIYYATGRTKLYRNIGAVVMLISLPISYFLVAPKNYFGFGLASEGLAVKMVIIQFISVNALLFYSKKIINIRILKLFIHQITTIIILYAFAYVSKLIVDEFDLSYIVGFIFSGAIYTLMVGIIVYLSPKQVSMRRKDVDNAFMKMKN